MTAARAFLLCLLLLELPLRRKKRMLKVLTWGLDRTFRSERRL